MEVEMAIIFAVVTGFSVIAMGMALFSEFRWKRNMEDRLKSLEKAERVRLQKAVQAAVEAEAEAGREAPAPLRKLASSRPPPP